MVIRRITRAKRVHDSHAVHALARQVSLLDKKTSLCVYRRARMLCPARYSAGSIRDRPYLPGPTARESCDPSSNYFADFIS